MSDSTMPERISAYINETGLGCFELHPNIPLTTEYIRADVAQAQLDAANKRNTEYVARQIVYLEIEIKAANARIAELLALVEADAQSMDKYKAIIRQLGDKDAELHAIIGQRNRRIAELDAQIAELEKQSEVHSYEQKIVIALFGALEDIFRNRISFELQRIAELEAIASEVEDEMAQTKRAVEFWREDSERALKRIAELEAVLRKCIDVVNSHHDTLTDARVWSNNDTATMAIAVGLLPEWTPPPPVTDVTP